MALAFPMSAWYAVPNRCFVPPHTEQYTRTEPEATSPQRPAPRRRAWLGTVRQARGHQQREVTPRPASRRALGCRSWSTGPSPGTMAIFGTSCITAPPAGPCQPATSISRCAWAGSQGLQQVDRLVEPAGDGGQGASRGGQVGQMLAEEGQCTAVGVDLRGQVGQARSTGHQGRTLRIPHGAWHEQRDSFRCGRCRISGSKKGSCLCAPAVVPGVVPIQGHGVYARGARSGPAVRGQRHARSGSPAIPSHPLSPAVCPPPGRAALAVSPTRRRPAPSRWSRRRPRQAGGPDTRRLCPAPAAGKPARCARRAGGRAGCAA